MVDMWSNLVHHRFSILATLVIMADGRECAWVDFHAGHWQCTGQADRETAGVQRGLCAGDSQCIPWLAV